MKLFKTNVGTAVMFSSILIILTGCNVETQRAKDLRSGQSNGFITIDDNIINLDTIRMSDGNVDIPFTFKNAGDEPLVLLNGETSCMCTTARVESDAGTSALIVMRGHGPTARIYHVIDPEEEAKLIATFDPNAHGPKGTGPIMRDITITTNSKRTPEVKFRFRGNVIP